MNSQLVESFKALAEREKTADKPNTFKIRSHLKVSKIIKELKFEITDSSQVKDISGIGTKTLEKIDEFLESGKLKSLEGFSTPEKKSSVSESKMLEGVTGIGPVKAKKLVDEGYTLNSLRKMFSEADASIYDILTHHQILGIKYYEDLLQRIPYDEITKVDQYLEKLINLVNTKHFKQGQFKHQICGSYRRQSSNSGDIDVLFYNTLSNNDDEEFFCKMMKTLISTNFLKDHLTDPEKVTTKYMGFCRLPRKKICRRIDMRCIKYSSLPAAQLYFTGSGEFNKNMRKFALKKGFTINEYGIYRLTESKDKGEQMKVYTEEDIFKVLGLKYIEPKDRLSTVIFK